MNSFNLNSFLTPNTVILGIRTLLMNSAAASVVSDSMRPHKRQPTRLLCPWDSLGKDTGVGCHFLLQCMHAW